MELDRVPLPYSNETSRYRAAECPECISNTLRDFHIEFGVGQSEDHDPRIWERGVYQLWLWLVVERLVVRRDELDVSELSVISKMLHDQRKLSLDEAKQQSKTDPEQGNGAAPSARLPEHFGEIVRQIYGTNFQDGGARPGEESN